MKTNPLQLKKNSKEKGQSFVELSLVFLVLLVLLVGMVEFGNLLNQYINLVDGAREGARFGSNDDPYQKGGITVFYGKIYQVVQGEFDAFGNQLSKGAINPIVLDPATDDIVVSVYSVIGNDPTTHNKKATLIDMGLGGPGSRYGNHESAFDHTDIERLTEASAPNTGVLLVEVFYDYHQILNFFSFGSKPGIIEVSTYSIMPLSAAEPTPTE